ncbi:restriction endonuclease [Coralloluteibacterium thermophilus]|uniref:Restriction endonuclease n=1 Tax=Coralloluteibacterium thermophilum TaxID=2707049 RepID=A0ABV9NNC0_9GAMM
MQPISTPLLLAAAVALALGGLAFWLVAIVGRQRREIQLGIAAMAALKWREIAGYLLEALRRRGYAEDPEAEVGERREGFDFMLYRQGRRHLVGCKHGTAYRLGASAVDDFARTLEMHGAAGGTLATLGTTDAGARTRAAAHGIELLDGAALWSEIRDFLPEATRDAVARQARRESRRRLGIATAGALTLGVLVFVLARAGLMPEPVAPAARVAGAAPAPASTAALVAPSTATAEPDESELQASRAAAARAIAAMPGVSGAVWATPSTLVLDLASADEAAVLAAVCGVLDDHPGLDLTRIQLQPTPGSSDPVRWRRCH